MSRNCAHSDMKTAPPPVVLFRERVLHDVMLHEVVRIASRRQRRQRLDNRTFAAVTAGSVGVLLVARPEGTHTKIVDLFAVSTIKI